MAITQKVHGRATTSPVSRRVLWKDKGIPDNHTDDDTFLKELRTNVNLRKYSYLEVVQGSGVVLQQICLAVLFVLIYTFIYQKWISAFQTVCTFSIAMIVMHLLYRYLKCSDQLIPTRDELQTFLVIYGFAFGISPILSTLTRTVSTDTIYSMVTGLLLANLAVHDYGPQAMVVSQAFSLNAGFAAAVCLASRLSSSMDAFALIISAAGVFGLWPAVRSVLKHERPKEFVWIAPVLILLDFGLILCLSRFFALLFVLLVISIGLLCPALLVWLQKYKTTIHGPWDEAIISHTSKSCTPPLES